MGTYLVILAIIVVMFIFSTELSAFLKKWFANPWIKLFVPLITMTVALIYSQSIALIALLYIKWGLYQLVFYLYELLPPGRLSWLVCAVFTLMLLSVVPVLAFGKWREKKSIIPHAYITTISAMLWLFFVIIYITNVKS